MVTGFNKSILRCGRLECPFLHDGISCEKCYLSLDMNASLFIKQVRRELIEWLREDCIQHAHKSTTRRRACRECMDELETEIDGDGREIIDA